MSVWVLGSLHLDVLVETPRLPGIDETLPGQGVRYAFGGKGGNQAVAAARMGAEVAMTGAVGTDAFAATLLEELDRAGVDRSRVAQAPGASGMSVALLLPGGDYAAVIVSGANLAVTGRARPPEGATHLLLQNEVPEEANLAAARAARARGLRVLLNAAPARKLPGALLAATDVLIVNRGEAAALAGLPEEEPAAAARALAARGPGTVVVTLGAAGLLRADAAGIRALPAPRVQALSAHGAGDAFAGALAARLDSGDGLDAALALAQAAAALHVATPAGERQRIGPAEVRALAQPR